MTAFKANQQRGSWIAKIENGFDTLGVQQDDPYVAVVIKDEFGTVEKTTNIYRHRPREDMGAWWALESSRRWRDLMSSGKPILLRAGMDWKTKSAGPKIAFFRIQNLTFGDEGFSFRIVDRLAECS